MNPNLVESGLVVPMPRASDAPPLTGSAVEATITVDGDLSGQLAVGNNIWQMRIDHVHGNLVLPAEEPPSVERRAAPLRLLPRSPHRVDGRAREVETARKALAGDLSVVVSGEAGVGKSTLLRHLAHDPAVPGPGGLAHLPVRGMGRDDVQQCLFDLCYDTDRPYRPSPARLRHYLQPIDCTFVLDDLELPVGELSELLDLTPRACVVLSRPDPVQLDGARAVPLLPLASRPPPPQHRLEAVVKTLAAPDRATLGVLAAVPGLRLDAECLQQLTAALDSSERLTALTAAGLVQTSDGVEFELTAGTGELLPVDDVANQRRRLADWLLTEAAGAPDGAFEAAVPGSDLPGTDLPGTDLRGSDHPDGGATRARSRRTRVSAAALLLLGLAGLRAWADVLALGRVVDAPLALCGRWDAWGEVLDAELRAARALDDGPAEGLVLHQLGSRALCLGDVDAARSLLTQALTIREAQGDTAGAAATKHNLDLLAQLAPSDSPPSDSPPSSGGTRLSARTLLRRLLALPLALKILVALLLLLPLAVADATDHAGDDRDGATEQVPAGQQILAPVRPVVPDRPNRTPAPSSGVPPSSVPSSSVPPSSVPPPSGPAVLDVPDPRVSPTPATTAHPRLTSPAPPAVGTPPVAPLFGTAPNLNVPSAPPQPPAVVPDTTPPRLALPGEVTVEATGPDGAAAPDPGSAVSAVDEVSGEVPVTCDVKPGSSLPLGTTVVTCTAQDGAGNTASGSYPVLVADRTGPVLTLPAAPVMTASSTWSNGEEVEYGPASAVDLVDGEVPASCAPPSGSWFPIGKTTVTCTARDSSGNATTGTFVVTVVGLPSG